MNKYLFALPLILVFFITACVKDEDNSKKKKLPAFEVAIEGSINPKFHAEGDCGIVHAMYHPLDQAYDNYRSIMIQGRDGDQLLSLLLYFKGGFPTDPVFELDEDVFGTNAWGIGMYQPDLNNPTMVYMTDERFKGTCTITSYDQTSQTISGTFSFTGQAYDNSATLAGVQASFTGTFTNVPINDLTDPSNPRGPCYGSVGDLLGGGTGNGNGGGSGGTGGGSGGVTYANLDFENPLYTDVQVTCDGETMTAPAGGKCTFSRVANSKVSYTAQTSGKTSDGQQVGLTLTWEQSNVPIAASGNKIVFETGSEYFFLYMINNSSKQTAKVYVNYGLQNQSLDNVSIPTNGDKIKLGYYKAFSNSNVRVESVPASNGSYSYWFWSASQLGLTGGKNMSTTLAFR